MLKRSIASCVEASWSSSSLQPRRATLRIESGLPAAIQIGGCGFCCGRRLDDDVLEVPVLAVMREPLVRRSTTSGSARGPPRSARRPPRSGCRSSRTRCGGSPCRRRNRAGRRTADRWSRPARPAAPDCARAARSPRCRAAASCVRAATQVSRLSVADTWPKPVKWCSTTKVLVVAERLGLDVVFDVFPKALTAVEVGAAALAPARCRTVRISSRASDWLIWANLVNRIAPVSAIIAVRQRPSPARAACLPASLNRLRPVHRRAAQIDRRDPAACS